ncbi:MAG: hypothetical protein AAGN82_09005 [Myxococcota bacterium]
MTKRRRRPRSPSRLGLAALLALLAAVSLGCESGSEPVPTLCGPFDYDPETQTAEETDDFPKVSSVLERRCGTLDCHGTLARPMRIYGAGGLRLFTLEEFNDSEEAQDNGTISGGVGTTAAEHDANRRSLCGLEPELTSAVVRGEAVPDDLMALRKPLLIERHKGGAVLQVGGQGAVCISCWLRGWPDDIDCQDAVTQCEEAVQDFL